MITQSMVNRTKQRTDQNKIVISVTKKAKHGEFQPRGNLFLNILYNDYIRRL